MKLSIFLTSIFVCFTSIISFADSTTEVKTRKTISTTIIRSKKTSTGNRPNAPSKIFIECQYGEGWINFSFPDTSNVLYVEISNDSETWTGVATLYEPTIETPCFEGLYTIQCTTDDDRIFIGELHY